jgi:hypothetical protein
LKQRDIIETGDNLLLYLFDCPHVPCHLKSDLCSSLVLLNTIELAMIFRVKITKVTTALDMLSQKRLLILESGCIKRSHWLQSVLARGQ